MAVVEECNPMKQELPQTQAIPKGNRQQLWLSVLRNQQDQILFWVQYQEMGQVWQRR